jgi:hypothetical protein
MSVSIETSGAMIGFKGFDAGYTRDAAGRRAIYKNLRWRQDHELSGVIEPLPRLAEARILSIDIAGNA